MLDYNIKSFRMCSTTFNKREVMERINWIRDEARCRQMEPFFLVSLQGPNPRICCINKKADSVELTEGDEIFLIYDNTKFRKKPFIHSDKKFLHLLSVGDHVFLGHDNVTLRVKHVKLRNDTICLTRRLNSLTNINELSKISNMDSVNSEDRDIIDFGMSSSISEIEMDRELLNHPAIKVLDHFNENNLKKHREMMNKLLKTAMNNDMIEEASMESDSITQVNEETEAKDQIKMPNQYVICEVIKEGVVYNQEKIQVQGKDLIQLLGKPCIGPREVNDINRAVEAVKN